MSLGVGIYGCGFIGKVHAYCYNNLDLFYDPPVLNPELIGVCTSQQKTAEKAKDRLGFDFWTTDYQDLLQNDDIQIVHCCTPNHLHHDFVIEAIKAGKHIYCEKPLALNYQQAVSIKETAEEYNFKSKNRKFQLTHNYRYLPATLKARQLVEEDFLGEVYGFRSQYLHSSYTNPQKPISWRMKKDKSGSGALGDLGSHALDLMFHLLGPFKAIMADQKTFINQRYPEGSNQKEKTEKVDVDDVTISLVRLKNGALGTLEAWRFATGSEDELRFEIHGRKGALRFNLMKPNWLEAYDNTQKSQPLGGRKGWQKIDTVQKYPEPAGFPSGKAPVGWIRSHMACLHAFLSAIKENKEPLPGLEDGIYIQKVLDAALKSAEKEKWQKI